MGEGKIVRRGGGSGSTVFEYNNDGTYQPEVVGGFNSVLNVGTLTTSRAGWGAKTTNKIVFAGGYNGTSETPTVDAFDINLTRYTPSALTYSPSSPGTSTVGGNAIIAGGFLESTVNAYNDSLTRSTPTSLSLGRGNFTGRNMTFTTDYALFIGGYTSGNGNTSTVDAYNSSLTRTTPTALDYASGHQGGTNFGQYAMVGGGGWGSPKVQVRAYDNQLARIAVTNLSKSNTGFMGAASNNTLAFFGGGYFPPSDVVDVYNLSLTRLTPVSYSIAAHRVMGISGDEYAILYEGSENTAGNINIYNTSGTRTLNSDMNQINSIGAGHFGNDNFLFAGGYDGTNWVNNVHQYIETAPVSEQWSLTLPTLTAPHVTFTSADYSFTNGLSGTTTLDGATLTSSVSSFTGTITMPKKIN